jgi:ribosomal protein S27E
MTADEAPIAELRPVPPANHAGHARPHVKPAVRIPAKRRVEFESWKLHTVIIYSNGMARDFKVVRLSDEFGQYVLHLRCTSCGHERECYPRSLANISGWDAALDHIEKRLRCSKCGRKSCRIRAVPMQKPRGQPPSH